MTVELNEIIPLLCWWSLLPMLCVRYAAFCLLKRDRFNSSKSASSYPKNYFENAIEK